MLVKDSSQNSSSQVSEVYALQRWLQSMHGESVLKRLQLEITQRCHPRKEDRILEIGGCRLLETEHFGSAFWLGIGMESASLLAHKDHLPFPNGSFSCVVVHRATFRSELSGEDMEEAARVLAPEGYFFLVDYGFPRSLRPLAFRGILPAGLRWSNARSRLRSVDLHVHGQHNLSLMPVGMSDSWFQVLSSVEKRAGRFFPFFASVLVTIGHRREIIPPSMRSQRMRFSRLWLRQGRGS